MDIYKEKKKLMNGTLFNHVATLTDLGSIKVLDFKDPKTICYGIRYIFDGNKIYVSGDLGYSIFNLTWEASEYAFNEIRNITGGYYKEKLVAFSEGKAYDFSEEKAWNEFLDDIKKHIKETGPDETKEKRTKMREAYNEMKESGFGTGYDSNEQIFYVMLREQYEKELIEIYGYDFYEHFRGYGTTINYRFMLHCLMLNIACEQLHPEIIENNNK